jgi:alcohol dehydrogenase
MQPFDYQPRGRITFGPGTLSSIGRRAVELGAERAMVVSDSGVVRAGHAQNACDALRESGVKAVLFDHVEPNPTSRHVCEGTEAAKSEHIDLLVGVGGGSSLDCAKGINFLLSNGGKISDYRGFGKAEKPMLPMIAVPTTAGTGSEMQSYALISDDQTHQKMACGDRKALPRSAILDATLTVTQPHDVTATAGIDAISHAIESYVSTNRNALSQTMAREAWIFLSDNYRKVLADKNDLDARGAMLLGASLAGMSIENSMLGAAHATANPLTAHYGITHGVAVQIMLPHVIRYNRDVAGGMYSDLIRLTGNGDTKDAKAGDALAAMVESYREVNRFPERLSAVGVEDSRLGELATEAAAEWTGRFNPRTVVESDLLRLYESAF